MLLGNAGNMAPSLSSFAFPSSPLSSTCVSCHDVQLCHNHEVTAQAIWSETMNPNHSFHIVNIKNVVTAMENQHTYMIAAT